VADKPNEQCVHKSNEDHTYLLLSGIQDELDALTIDEGRRKVAVSSEPASVVVKITKRNKLTKLLGTRKWARVAIVLRKHGARKKGIGYCFVVEKKVISPSRAGMVRCLLKIAAASMQEQIKGNLLPPPPQLNNLTHLVITNVFWGSLGEHKQSVSQSVSHCIQETMSSKQFRADTRNWNPAPLPPCVSVGKSP
jgi:hypothetical protein